jgi:putative tryptophan/tyrosine transport system substrate-binding protein
MTIRRRDFITLLGGAAAWPVTARAQQPALPVVGLLLGGAAEPNAPYVAAFRKGLAEAGFVEGRTVAIEYRYAGNAVGQLPGLAVDLVRRQVAVIVATGGPPARAAKAATTTIPIVFSGGVDPVGAGLVLSLNRPGGNLTGVTSLGDELVSKRLGLLHELIPAAPIMAMLVNPTRNVETNTRDLQAAARTLGLQLEFLHASTERELDMVFATWSQLRAGALVIGADNFFAVHSEQLAALMVRHAVPTIGQFREFAAAGGLISYGTSATDQHRQIGVYTGRILKGDKPADLPVQQSTKVELIINLKTAKALGLTVPPNLLAIADEVIE